MRHAGLHHRGALDAQFYDGFDTRRHAMCCDVAFGCRCACHMKAANFAQVSRKCAVSGGKLSQKLPKKQHKLLSYGPAW